MTILETDRLILRHVTPNDAPFIIELVNEPDWLRYIGDKHVRTPEEAVSYIAKLTVMYENPGYGFYAVESKEHGCAIGICGLIRREALDDADLGFAYLSRYGRNGYAFEAATAALAVARSQLGLKRVAAITDPQNAKSIALLERLGFHFENAVRLSPNAPLVNLYAREEL